MRDTRRVANGEEPSAVDPAVDRVGELSAASMRDSQDQPTSSLRPAVPKPAGPRAPARHRRSPLALARDGVAALRRPHGQLAMTGLFIVALVAITGTAGAYLVPTTVQVDARPAGAGTSAGPDVAASGSATASVPTSLPSAGSALSPSYPPTSTASPKGAAAARPADVLSGWAETMSSKVDVSVVALKAYGYAELVVARTTPGCGLSWTTLAAIGKVESDHGTSNNATLYPDGRALPQIIGPALDGSDGRAKVTDSDRGALDQDPVWDRAVGPMQFIPSTWRTNAVDADNDGVRDPHNIYDAALAAANYLCAKGRDLSTPTGWWQAIAAYNVPRSYGEMIFKTANLYGTRSRG